MGKGQEETRRRIGRALPVSIGKKREDSCELRARAVSPPVRPRQRSSHATVRHASRKRHSAARFLVFRRFTRDRACAPRVNVISVNRGLTDGRPLDGRCECRADSGIIHSTLAGD
jgi:hypothetical protein